MKFKISQEDLAKALVSVNKSLSSKTNLPILSNILVSAETGKIEILSTSLETATKVAIKCRVETPGKTTIPGRVLGEFVPQLPNEEVTFEKLGEEVLVSTKKHKARFATMPVEDFPAIPKIEKGKTVLVPSEDFLKSTTRVVFCAAQDEARPVLAGVLWDFGKSDVSVVATDGYRLSFQKIAIKNGEGFNQKIILPARALVEAAKLVSEAQEEAELKIIIAESLNQAIFKIGNVEFTSRVIDGEFPAWQKLIPNSFSTSAKIPKEEFIRLVRITSIFAREAGNIVKLNLVVAAKEGGVLTISATNNQVGSNEASCSVELAGKGGEIAFNFRYLLEMLSSVEGEEIVFEMIESLNPGRLTLPGDSDYFHIIMPVRLQG